ncbi:MinD/ParA family protein [Methylomonas sp. LW13]|uniref:MinD/ParA family ATP-binding protein n=1 Tax=unclassified Methylomonas TaxID=2608980 RepID=UPI0006914439|nr:AAA family ATPase [Methylomonas sp. LW13]QBC27200.1 MinD/ParA family protein [Methylomonas sp. LW13]
MDSLYISEQGPSKPHLIVFAGAKSGVGKTSVVANVAAAMALRGKRVCVVDVDTGLSNINALLGLRPAHRLEQVLRGEKAIAEVLLKTGDGVGVVSAAHLMGGAPVSAEQTHRLAAALADLETQFDYFLIDTAATHTETLLRFIELAQSTFLVVSGDPAALTDAFALLKSLNTRQYTGSLRVLVNQAVDYPAATDTYRRFAAVAEKCLKLKVEYGGFVIRDENLPKAVALQMSVVDLAVNSPASRCLLALADNIIKHIGCETAGTGLVEYWQRLLSATPTRQIVGDDADAEPVNALSPADRAEMSISELSRRLLLAMKRQLLDQPALERFIGEFVETYCEQFGRFPNAFKPLFYRWLETENYAEPRLIELVATLEALHAMRYQRPMFSLEENAARLVAQLQGQQEQHKNLVEQLCAAYRQAFHTEVFDAEQMLLERMQADDFTEQHFEELLQKLRDGFQTRFKRPYQSRHELALASAVEALNVMGVDQHNLQDEITMLMHGFQLLGSRREKLLTTLNALQNSGLPLAASAVRDN